MHVWKELCVSEPSGLRFAFLWSPPCSPAQYSSRGRNQSRNLESRTQNQTSGFLCAVRPQLPHTAAGRRFTDGFQGPERPLSVTSPLLLSLFLSLCQTQTDSLRRWSQKKRSPYCLLTSHSPHDKLAAEGTCCQLSYLCIKTSVTFYFPNSKYYSKMRHWTSANSFDGYLSRMWPNALLHRTVKYVEICWKPNQPTVTFIRLGLIWHN